MSGTMSIRTVCKDSAEFMAALEQAARLKALGIEVSIQGDGQDVWPWVVILHVGKRPETAPVAG